MGNVALDLGVIVNIYNALLIVDLGSFRLVEFHGSALVSENIADRFHNRTVRNQTGGTGRQQGSEEEVVTGGDDDDIVVFGIELLQKGDRTPSGPWMSIESETVKRHTRRGQGQDKARRLPRITRVFLDGSGSNCSTGYRS